MSVFKVTNFLLVSYVLKDINKDNITLSTDVVLLSLSSTLNKYLFTSSVQPKKVLPFILLLVNSWTSDSHTQKINVDSQKQPPEVFFKKGILKNFAKFRGKNLCQIIFFDKVTGIRQILRNFEDTFLYRTPLGSGSGFFVNVYSRDSSE